MQVERSRRVTGLAVATLAETGVIRPWQIRLKTKTGQGEQAIGGLHHIDEAALSALPDDVFLKLRKTAAELPIVYAQMLSAAQLGNFEHLDRLQKPTASSPVAKLPETVDSLFEMPADDAIRFE
jgi:hypothetical protein